MFQADRKPHYGLVHQARGRGRNERLVSRRMRCALPGREDHVHWWKRATAWALGVTAATIPLYFVLQNDRDLQRTELGIADQHAAYTDFLNAADAVIGPQFWTWFRIQKAGGEANLSEQKRSEISEELGEIFYDRASNERAFQDAATRLRLVIAADDAHLISSLSDTLQITSIASEGLELTPDELLENYTNAKLSLVNEFRSDVLGQDGLPGSESEKMNAQTLELVKRDMMSHLSNPREAVSISSDGNSDPDLDLP